MRSKEFFNRYENPDVDITYGQTKKELSKYSEIEFFEDFAFVTGFESESADYYESVGAKVKMTSDNMNCYIIFPAGKYAFTVDETEPDTMYGLVMNNEVVKFSTLYAISGNNLESVDTNVEFELR